MARFISVVSQEILARAYYGLPLYEKGDVCNKKRSKTLSLKTCRRNEWITEDNKITAEGLRLLIRECRKK